jgi:hypothetical protein
MDRAGAAQAPGSELPDSGKCESLVLRWYVGHTPCSPRLCAVLLDHVQVHFGQRAIMARPKAHDDFWEQVRMSSFTQLFMKPAPPLLAKSPESLVSECKWPPLRTRTMLFLEVLRIRHRVDQMLEGLVSREVLCLTEEQFTRAAALNLETLKQLHCECMRLHALDALDIDIISHLKWFAWVQQCSTDLGKYDGDPSFSSEHVHAYVQLLSRPAQALSNASSSPGSMRGSDGIAGVLSRWLWGTIECSRRTRAVFCVVPFRQTLQAYARHGSDRILNLLMMPTKCTMPNVAGNALPLSTFPTFSLEIVQLLSAVLPHAACNPCTDTLQFCLNLLLTTHSQLVLPMGSAVTHAARSGNIPALKLLHESRAEMAQTVRDELSLISACTHGQTATVNWLLQQRAEARACDDTGSSALLIACNRGHTEIAQLLLEAKADWSHVGNALETIGSGSWTPLHSACFRGCVSICELLILHRADVNSRCGFLDGSSLSMAVMQGHASIVRILLAHGARVTGSQLEWIEREKNRCPNNSNLSEIQALLCAQASGN